MEKRHVGQAAWEGPTRTFQCVDRPLSGTQAIGTEVRAGRSAKGLQGMKPRRSLLSRATEEGLSASHRSTFFSELPVGQWYSAWPRSPCRRPSDRAAASITWTAPWRDHFKKLASGSNTNVLKNPLAVIFKTMRSHWDPLQSKAGMVLSGCHAWKAAGSSREDAEEGAQLSEIHRRETTSRQVAFHSYRFPLLTGAPVLSDPRSGFPQPRGVVCGDAQGALAGSGPGPSRENSPLRGSLSRGPEPPEQGDLHPWSPCWPPTSHPAPGAPCAAGAQPPLRIPPLHPSPGASHLPHLNCTLSSNFSQICSPLSLCEDNQGHKGLCVSPPPIRNISLLLLHFPIAGRGFVSSVALCQILCAVQCHCPVLHISPWTGLRALLPRHVELGRSPTFAGLPAGPG